MISEHSNDQKKNNKCAKAVIVPTGNAQYMNSMSHLSSDMSSLSGASMSCSRSQTRSRSRSRSNEKSASKVHFRKAREKFKKSTNQYKEKINLLSRQNTLLVEELKSLKIVLEASLNKPAASMDTNDSPASPQPCQNLDDTSQNHRTQSPNRQDDFSVSNNNDSHHNVQSASQIERDHNRSLLLQLHCRQQTNQQQLQQSTSADTATLNSANVHRNPFKKIVKPVSHLGSHATNSQSFPELKKTNFNGFQANPFAVKDPSRAPVLTPGSLKRSATVSITAPSHSTSTSSNATSPINAQPPSATLKTNAVKPTTPPPLVCFDLDCKAARSSFATLLGHTNFDLDGPRGNCTYVRTRCREDYDIIAAAIEDSQLEHHRYTPFEDRVINVLLFKMDPSYSAKDIEEGINELELDIRIHKVMPFETDKATRTGKSLNIWLVQLEPNSDVQALLKIKRLLCHSNINFERRKNSGVIQCKNCQNFGHTAHNCSRMFRCVKCVVAHGPRQCPSDVDRIDNQPKNPPACVNCGALDHPANFRGCPAYVQLIRRKQERTTQQRELQKFRQQSANNFRKENISFANAVRHERPTPSMPASIDGNPLSYIQEECKRLFNNDLFTIMEKCREFVPRHRLIVDRQEKAFAMLEFIASLSN